MHIIYALEDLPETITASIFLAGCTPRSKEVESWRKDAIQILNDIGFDGTVFIPEPRSGDWKKNYDAQVEWEEQCLNVADCILFWVPRDLSTDSEGNLKMPAFTTNVEFGMYCQNGRVVLGYPEDAEKMSYLQHYADKLNIPSFDNLTDTLRAAIEKLGEGSERTGGERHVPLMIWNTDSFQSWYQSQKQVGNRLDNARVLWNFRPGNKDFVFAWVLHVDVYIEAEGRIKSNEFVFSRTDISSVLMYRRHDPIETSEVVLVKEFRSPVSNSEGFVFELAGGSSPKKGTDPIETAVEEIHEECGILLEPERLKSHSARQMVATLSSHKAHLYSVELTEEEMDWIKSQEGVVRGKQEDTEQTTSQVHTVQELLKNDLVDWSNVGMIMQVLYGG